MTIDKTKLALALFVAFATIITCVNPIYPHEQLLQHIGTALLFIPLITDVFKKTMPMSAFAGLACFTILHVIGARYIYSYVPYKELAVSLGLVDTGFFQDPRNHYDRLVHFSFGVLLFPYLVYICKKWFKQQQLIAVFMAWLMIQTGSMIYELFEWLLTIVMTEDAADCYNGQQGDMWDAQKDMALALLGSTAMLFCYMLRYANTKRQH
jgi:integral membrane protein